ncbi:MAG: sodium:calcium antiporter, partial [Actinomycetes bacterium]
NATMTLGASALARPLHITSPHTLHLPLVAMVAALTLALGLSWRRRSLGRLSGGFLLACYPAFVAAVVIIG